MSAEWKNLEPAPIEFMHGRMMDLFHEWRRSITKNITVPIDGTAFNNIIAKAKTETYKKYDGLGIDKPIPKDKMKVNIVEYKGKKGDLDYRIELQE